MSSTQTVYPNTWGVVGLSQDEAERAAGAITGALVFGPNGYNAYQVWTGDNLLISEEQIEEYLQQQPAPRGWECVEGGEEEAEEASTQDRVREALSKAGHGAVATDTYGGDGLIGFFTVPTPDAVYVGFGCQVGQSFRFAAEAMAGLTGPMQARYSITLREAGFKVQQRDNVLLVRA